MAKRKLDSINRTSNKRSGKAKAPASPVVPLPDASPEPQLELEDFLDSPEANTLTDPPVAGRFRRLSQSIGRIVAVFGVLGILYVVSFEVAHIGKIYPGVDAEGVGLSGLSQPAAQSRLEKRATVFNGQVLTIKEGNSNLRIPVANLSPVYDAPKAAELAFQYGREGDWKQQWRAKLRSMLGRPTEITTLKYDAAKLAPYLTSLYDEAITPVQNAQLAFNDNRAQVTPAQPGTRLNLGRLAEAIHDRLAATSTEAINAPVYHLAPTLDTQSLGAAVSQINDIVAKPITLEWNGTQREIDQATIITWINVSSQVARPFLSSMKVDDLYPAPATANLGLSQSAVKAYVTNLAGAIDQSAQNAGLAMQNGQLSVIQSSRAGQKLDQDATFTAINDSLKNTNERRITLKLAITQAEVREDNLESLGIKEMISEGETYFPGSPNTRLINVRTGAKRYNGVLLKPGQTFSFGEILGEVGPAQGYVPELVILDNHEEKQYGGGLCQVSSTAFRAALAAGLPITERHNHSFAISYYTWPYSAPGVDATIYYPDVDFKFVNDTGHYILIQTIMNGVNLKFQYFGTKTKSGVLRGPTFITGSSDATQPSHTVFYRDVLDLNGTVVKTDTFHTWYKSSKDFPIVKEFN